MRDGYGNKLSEDDAAKVRAPQIKPSDASPNTVSIDPKPEPKPAERLDEKPQSPAAPKF